MALLHYVTLLVTILATCQKLCAARCGRLYYTSTDIPIFDAEDCVTNYDLGYAVGRAFDDKIVDMVYNKTVLRKIERFVATPEGSQLLQRLKTKHEGAFPAFYSEMQGMADGAGVKFDSLFELALRHELAAAMGKALGEDACSAITASYKDTKFIAHNEDNPGASMDLTFYLRGKQGNVRWLAFVYAGELATSAFGFNSMGLGFTQNAVTPLEIHYEGIGRAFHSRSVLNATTAEDAIRVMVDPDGAFGRSWNLADIKTGNVYNIETGPLGINSIYQLNDTALFHANLYQRLNISQRPDDSSSHREARASEIGLARRPHDAVTILGDNVDPLWPIYRHNDGRHEFTLCTVLMDVSKKHVTVFHGNPKDGQVGLKITLPDLKVWPLPRRQPDVQVGRKTGPGGQQQQQQQLNADQ